MKIIKEDLDNLERVENRQTVQGIMMKDAEEQSKKSEDNFKEVAGNPEDLKKKKPFISGEKQPKPKDVKLPKPELEESLFEEAEKHTYYVKFKQNGKPYVVEFDAYNIEGAEQAFLRSFPDIKSRNEYEILSKDGGSLTHNYNESLMNEAGGVKDGVLMSTDGEPLTFWDKIYAELDATAGDDYDYLKLREVPAKNKDRYVEIGVTQSGDIKVFAPEKQMLKHAVNVANYYGLDYIVDTSVGFNDPQKAFYCLVRIPEELGDTEITYDVRKPETMKKNNNTQVA